MRSLLAQRRHRPGDEPFNDSGDPIQRDALKRSPPPGPTSTTRPTSAPARCGPAAPTRPRSPAGGSRACRFVGGILEGAGEAVWDLLTMAPFSPVNMVIDDLQARDGRPHARGADEEVRALAGERLGHGRASTPPAPRPDRLRQGARQEPARLGHLGRRPGPRDRPPRARRDHRRRHGRHRCAAPPAGPRAAWTSSTRSPT